MSIFEHLQSHRVNTSGRLASSARIILPIGTPCGVSSPVAPGISAIEAMSGNAGAPARAPSIAACNSAG